MAFGGTGFSFGGNNTTNNNTQSTGFGGFGAANTNTGFGTSTTNTGFGASTTGTNPFGGGTSTFGTNTGGFGASNTNTGSSLFGGNKPATANPFGSTTGSTSLFGNNNNNTSNTGGFGSGGFGSNANTNTTTNTGGFGGTGTNTGFTFGASTNKPAFGASTTTPLFGQGGAGTTGGFGSTGAFGSSGTGTALNQPVGPSEGTGSTPFAPTSEKESNGVTNSYQSITFQQPYQKYSFEELRLADYNAGRQFGNGSGQPGAFGNNAFGGFGNTAGGGFGNTNTTANPFGATSSSSAFGGNTATTGFGGGAGLFGNNANKPAGGLFGSTTTSAGTTGGLFGTTNNTNTGFGNTGTSTGFGTNTASTGGLFGNNNQNKPAGGLFGNTANTTNNAFSFGNNNAASSNTTGGGLFGNTNTTSTSGGLFGNTNNQAASTGGGLFGNTNNNQQSNSLFGNKTGTGFGTATTQGQTGGLFGTANTNTGTSGGLFGNTNNASTTGTTGGLFGNNTNQSGGLFGNNANNANQAGQKSLFGSGFGTNTATNTGGGLFSNTGNTNQPSGGLFGNTNNASGGFNFGNNNANKPTTSLFGNTNTNQQGGGLFGSTNNNTSLFGTSQNTQQNNAQQQDGVRHSSLLDPNPYGQSSIWTGLPQPTPENAKPVFTPLTATQKMKESMMKPPPSLRLNQSRYMTPPRRNGYGFSYSTYGTPNSAASTPGGAGLSGSMYGSRGFSGGSFGRSFNKSASVQNLRSQFASDSDDIWKPGAFASTHRNSGGSIKRLTIDRTIRNDLFSRPSLPALPAPEQPSTRTVNGTSSASQVNGEVQHDASNKLKKRVSFENGTSGGHTGQLNGESGALVRTETDDSDIPEEAQNRNNVATTDSQTRGKDLAAVPEDRESHPTSTRPPTDSQAKADPKPGDYWMNPSRAEQAKLPRERLQRFKDFQVGRHGCGNVVFNGTVDLTALPMDELYDKIVEIRLRSITVYPDASSKPPVGRGLNVPSTLSIENSWPRSRSQPSSATSGPVYDKHIQRLKKMAGTEFVNYEATTGIWTFRVPHYTRYGLDYDEDDEMSHLDAPPDTIEKSAMDVEEDEFDNEHDDDNDDDTFAFRQKTIPGGFGRQSAIDYEPKSTALIQSVEHDSTSDHSAYSEDEMSEDEPSMVGSYPAPSAINFESPNRPILAAGKAGTPGKPLLDLEGDWAEQLQRTISPRKQNRDMLRDTQNKVLIDRAYSPIKPKQIEKKDFRTSIDVMNSLFGLSNEQGNKGRKQGKAVEPDFEFPYAKRTKTFDPTLQTMSEADRKWHESFKTQFTNVGDLIHKGKSADTNMTRKKNRAEEESVGSQGEAVIKSSFEKGPAPYNSESVIATSEVMLKDDIPFAQRKELPFSEFSQRLLSSSSSQIESDVYSLLHILFDDYEDEFNRDLSAALRQEYEAQIRKDRLTKFLSAYVMRIHGDKLAKVEKENPTAAAVIRLTARDIEGACDCLEQAQNYKLMVLVSQLGSADGHFQDSIKSQLDAWREQRVLSEMTEDIRAIYELCAGNTTISSGRSGNNVPVEDKAKTFSIGDEYELDWVQSFALGLWFGRDEKSHPSLAGVVSIENAVLEFERRCQRKEESQVPGNDPLWVVLQTYAATKQVRDVEMPVFPTALEALNDTWDASRALSLHYSIITNIEHVSIDENAEEELAGLLAYQLSSNGDIAGAALALLHLHDSTKREAMLKSLLERFAGQLPDPPSASATNAPNAISVSSVAESNDAHAAELWTTLTRQLLIPEAWLYQAKALHARAVSADSSKELQYLVAARSWEEAHQCFTHRVAPGLVVDNDIEALTTTVNLFEDDVMEKVSGWEMGGGVYSDFALMCTAKGHLNQAAVDGLRKRLVELGRRFKKDVDLGKLPVEELEERVALQEMSRLVAAKFDGSQSDLLELPLTSDQRMVYAVATTG